MQRSRFPSRDRLGVLTAVIVLAYTLSRALEIPPLTVSLRLPGWSLDLAFGGATLTLLLVAALISTGADTVIRSHPRFRGRTTLVHWIAPGATALVLGAALNVAPEGPIWWSGLGLSAIALIAVLVAEYRLVDPGDPARNAAVLALTALTYALALTLFGLLHSLGARTAVAATVGGVTAAALAWRLFALRAVPPAAAAGYALIVGVISAEIIWAVNYWRITPAGAALLVMLPFYVAVGLIQQHLTGRLTARVWVEYLVVGLAALALSLAGIIR